MSKGLSRVIGVRGAAPVPGQDAVNAPWQEAMHRGELVIFYYDRNGESVNPTGKKASAEMLQVALAFRSRFDARLTMKGTLKRFEGVTVAMYDKQGHWLETRSPDGTRLRNETLEYAKYVLQYPVVVACGILAVVGAIIVQAKFFGGLPLDWTAKTASERGEIVLYGALLGLACRGAWHLLRLQAVKAAVIPALSPMGSKQREEFYRQMERRKNDQLTPLEPELDPAEITWPDFPKHKEWEQEFLRLGFEKEGSYLVRKMPSFVEFYFNAEKDVSGAISYISTRDVGMYIDMTTRYEDGLLFSVVAKESAGLDPHPKRKSVRLPRTATVEEVFQKMLSERPQGAIVKPVRELVVPRFKQSWREYVEWRRERGTTAEEYKRIDERRMARKRAGEP